MYFTCNFLGKNTYKWYVKPLANWKRKQRKRKLENAPILTRPQAPLLLVSERQGTGKKEVRDSVVKEGRLGTS